VVIFYKPLDAIRLPPNAAVQVDETTDEVTFIIPVTAPQSFFRLQFSQ